MAVIVTNLSCDLQDAVKVQYLDGNLFSMDNAANQINVYVYDGGEPATISGTVSASVIRADGGTVAVEGSLYNNIATITLPQAAYYVPGLVNIAIKITTSGINTTIADVVANVYQTSTETAVDPGTIIPSIQDLISQIQTAVGSIPLDYSELSENVKLMDKTSLAFDETVQFSTGSIGYIKLADGGFASSNNWRCSIDFIRLNTNTKWLIFSRCSAPGSTTLSAVASLAFYSSNNVESFISSVPLKNAAKSISEYIVEIPNNAKYIRYSCYPDYLDQFYIKGVPDAFDLFDNDDIKIYTRLNHSNEASGIGSDSMLIRLKKSAFSIGVSNNHRGYANAWEGTWNAYYWLMNNPEYMFATNCNFSGGYTAQEIAEHHYPMRYAGVNYDEGSGGAPVKRPFFCVDIYTKDVAYYARESGKTMYEKLQEIPSKYQFCFACGNLLIENGVVITDPTIGADDPVPEGKEKPIDDRKRMPRNVFGWDDDYFYIWFCEGRNDKNGGYKFEDMISRLQSYGIQNAVNLDGGGSVNVSANIPNTVKINEYVDPIKIRPTALNLHYKYFGNNANQMSANAKAAILAYVGNVFRPYRADLMRVLGTIYGHGKVNYVYHEERGGYYRLEVVQNAPTLLYITFDSFPVLTYNSGDALNLTGTVIAASYDNDTVLNVTDECVFTPTNGAILSSSDTTLTVSYTDNGITKTVNVPLIVT